MPTDVSVKRHKRSTPKTPACKGSALGSHLGVNAWT